MKKRMMMVVLMAGMGIAHSQTPITNAAPTVTLTNLLGTAGVSSNALSLIDNVGHMLVDSEPYVKNGAVLIEVGALKLGSDYGAFVDVQFPVNTNSWQMTYGTAIGYISNRVYSATLNVTLGTQVSIPGATNLPFVGKYLHPVYVFAESGPGYNFQAHQVVAQYMGGVKYLQPLGKYGIGASYALGGISDLRQKLQEFSLFFTAPW